MRVLRRFLPWIAVAVGVLLAVVIGIRLLPVAVPVGVKVADQFPSSGGAPQAIAGAQISDAGPGSLVSATTMPQITRTLEGGNVEAARVVYRSTNGDTNTPTVVSGSVFVPKGAAPQGGWPVVSIGHGTVGIDGPCAPSLSDSLGGALIAVHLLTKQGYAVALADYQGLGTKGVHPYPDSRTAGLNMIDAVRALRHTFPDVSDRWAAFGHSQGGGASWAADEQAAGYAPELHLVGAVAASPAADVSGIVLKAQYGTLTSDQRPVIQAIIESLARIHPDLNRDDYRQGAGAKYWEVLTACTGPQVAQRSVATKQLGQNDFAPRTPEAADRLRGLLEQWALPQKPLSAPLSVWYGGADTYVDADWTTAAIRRACALGGDITIEFAPDKGHSQVDVTGQLKWLQDRFDGKPAANDC